MKNAGLRIRVQRDLRDQFMAACRKQDKPSAQAIREFTRQYVASHETVQSSDTEGIKTSPPHRGQGKKNIQKKPVTAIQGGV